MRTIIEIELDTTTANEMVRDGALPGALGDALAALKPEAAYFYPRNGRRTALMVVDLPDEASLVTFCEPFWQQSNAAVFVAPCMTAEELQAGMQRLGEQG